MSVSFIGDKMMSGKTQSGRNFNHVVHRNNFITAYCIYRTMRQRHQQRRMMQMAGAINHVERKTRTTSTQSCEGRVSSHE